MASKLDELLNKLWDDYASLNPQARQIAGLLSNMDEHVVNDHIAFRTFNIPMIGLDALARPFEQLGYIARGDYEFKAKKLNASHYEHLDPERPKIFISELQVENLSSKAQKIIHRLVDQVDEDLPMRDDFPAAGRPWDVSFKEYSTLVEETEYGGWLAALGFRANHFTICVNHLRKFRELEDLNHYLRAKGFELNTSGGEVKGGPEQYLAQSSTLAAPVEVEFSDGKHVIPGCYYEFARRYLTPRGQLFQGFVAQSADKIFESTDRQQKQA